MSVRELKSINMQTHTKRIQLGLVAAAILGLAGACGVVSSPECEAYVQCQEHYDTVRNRDPSEVNKYLPDGICWESQDIADDCTAECSIETEELRDLLTESNDALGACG